MNPSTLERPVLIIVRHGQTDYNINRRFQGQLNVPLNPTGVQQAHKSAKVVSDLLAKIPKELLESTRVLSSDLARCSQTAQVLHEKIRQEFGDHIEFELSQLLREQNTGMLQGITLDEFHTKYANLAHTYEESLKVDPYGTRPPGETAESKMDVANRLKKFIQTTLDPVIQSGKPGVNILCSHGWTLNVMVELLSVYLGPPETYIGNGDVAIVGLGQDHGIRSTLAQKMNVKHRWHMLDHIEVGERIGSLSLIRKVA